jgi:UDP-2-acetamido-2-deoxy-ribo-hexuluronate aminotransferase
MAQGTGAALYYPTPLNELPGLREVLQDLRIYPNASKLSESLITLPVHGGVKERHRQKIIEAVMSEQ